MTHYDFEEKNIKMNELELILYCFEEMLLKREYKCETCINMCKLKKHQRNIDKYAWRCCIPVCRDYEKYFSIRKNSFFVNFRVKIRYILRVLFKYSAKHNEYTIKNSLNLDDSTVEEILKKIKN
ncbi:hypothetical protein H312_00939 [Anncaliia algerae PRA339]|uniref:Uncharacterized protein n=1 Tax=Anncaliia algerae PRA339 TaxID=1288291 RepID=A0A059F359_9MICR|nr:hypothetical protein H312_00939 [Anncaliia algerae PRA339]